MNHRLGLLEADLEKAEAKLNETKASAADAESSKTTSDALQRKVQLLEEELDAAEKTLKETNEKYVLCTPSPPHMYRSRLIAHPLHRLRQVDVKAEHFERQVTRIEQERDAWEQKYEVRRGSYLLCESRLLIAIECRRLWRSTTSPRRSWTSWSPAWRAFKSLLGVPFCD